MGVVGADGRRRGPLAIAAAARPRLRGRRGAVRKTDVFGRRGVRPTAERHGKRPDQSQRSESGAGSGRRTVRDNVHGRRAVPQLGSDGQRRVRAPAYSHRVHRIQMQQPAPPDRQKVSMIIVGARTHLQFILCDACDLLYIFLYSV